MAPSLTTGPTSRNPRRLIASSRSSSWPRRSTAGASDPATSLTRPPPRAWAGARRPRRGRASDPAWVTLCIRPDACPRAKGPDTSGENDLPSGGQVVELAHGDDVLDLVDQVCFGEAEQVGGRLAPVQARAGVGDHLDELRDGGDVELLHLVAHVVGHGRRHAR